MSTLSRNIRRTWRWTKQPRSLCSVAKQRRNTNLEIGRIGIVPDEQICIEKNTFVTQNEQQTCPAQFVAHGPPFDIACPSMLHHALRAGNSYCIAFSVRSNSLPSACVSSKTSSTLRYHVPVFITKRQAPTQNGDARNHEHKTGQQGICQY